jgi:hypothetical protein
MTRLNLSVPFAEKDAAKRLGAKWDNVRSAWYVPDGLDTAPFQKWFSDLSGIEKRSPPDVILFEANADGEFMARIDSLEVTVGAAGYKIAILD